jgi:hypothetical protein
MNDFYAGLLSGLFSNIICNPFDVIRTNKQLNNKIYYNISFLTRGLKSGIITIPTFWSIYFETYKNLKEYNKTNYKFLNGYLSSNIASTITCPLWFIRQKNQISDKFNVIDFYIKNGIKPFYNALFNTYLINSSFIIQIPVYEKLKIDKTISKKIKNDTIRIFLITSFSKIIASCVFYPFDTIRTLKRNNFNDSYLNIIKKLNKNPIKYYNGLYIYLIRSIPYHTSVFCSYEYLLNKKL